MEHDGAHHALLYNRIDAHGVLATPVCAPTSFHMLDMIGAVKRLANRGRISVSEAQLGFDFFASADASASAAVSDRPDVAASSGTGSATLAERPGTLAPGRRPDASSPVEESAAARADDVGTIVPNNASMVTAARVSAETIPPCRRAAPSRVVMSQLSGSVGETVGTSDYCLSVMRHVSTSVSPLSLR